MNEWNMIDIVLPICFVTIPHACYLFVHLLYFILKIMHWIFIFYAKEN